VPWRSAAAIRPTVPLVRHLDLKEMPDNEWSGHSNLNRAIGVRAQELNVAHFNRVFAANLVDNARHWVWMAGSVERGAWIVNIDTLERQNDFYEDEQEMVLDYAAAVNAEIKDLFAAGADIVQIDEPYIQARPEKARQYGLRGLDAALELPGRPRSTSASAMPLSSTCGHRVISFSPPQSSSCSRVPA
jgi:hypothetical protein